ncbi:MAG: GNAT family N-acetyltransferase [Labilithrix sp.]|nr:GNAT family N-acetyltransferase [Labilithrix sp.]MCW5813099.1 GNAT family N-acetyltransferase [Labilithrix sp.]
MSSAALTTARLELRPFSLAVVRALLEGRPRPELEALVGAELPWTWPSRALVEQAFSASLDAIVAAPDTRLWGDRLMVTREAPARVVGSVVFHGRPGPDGVAEVAFGVEDASQGKGYAREALAECIAWALAQPECSSVRATTTDWHRASKRLLEHVGMKQVGEHVEGGARMLVYEARRA